MKLIPVSPIYPPLLRILGLIIFHFIKVIESSKTKVSSPFVMLSIE